MEPEQKKSIIRISNVLNLTRQEFNIIEKHIFLLTLLNLKEHQGFQLEFKEDSVMTISFSTTELKETNRERIKEALDKITSRKIFFDNSTKDTDYFGYVVPFISAKYQSHHRISSSISVKLNPDCQKLFLELANGYSSTDLKAILNLKSVYAIRVYELMNQYLNQGEWTVSLENFRKLLDLDNEKYSRFPDFKRYILEYSQSELWEHCGIHFEWEVASKERKKVTALRFYISSREKQERIEVQEDIKRTIDFVSSLSPVQIAHTYNQITSKYTLTPEQADYIFVDRDRLNEFIRVDLIIEDMIQKGKPPQNRTKYLAKSLGLDRVKFKKSKNN